MREGKERQGGEVSSGAERDACMCFGTRMKQEDTGEGPLGEGEQQ